jgi:hypothetical protein
MFFSDLRVAVFVVYAVLVTWRISLGAPEGYWTELAAPFVGGTPRCFKTSHDGDEFS